MLYHAFHTTRESRLETQPHITKSGAVVTWDGRLDNRAELVGKLGNGLSMDATDVAIVAGAYEKWGTECFAQLIGDWALSIWDPRDRALILAKDPFGTRHLFYTLERDSITWSTLLDPLVLFSGRPVKVDEEYVAGWLVFSPATHLTPYVGIHAVSPAFSVVVRNDKASIRKYWDFDPDNRVRYRTDAEYEEHFRKAFAASVQRRLRSDAPILSELSGGMDSTSIVCVADTLIAGGGAEAPRLDTISYYNDSEPNWNERPYFVEVENKRGRTGCHINVSSQNISSLGLESSHFAAIPGSYSPPSEFTDQFAFCMTSQGNRVLLSGIGGDEVTGGVPTPTPELADLLVRAQVGALAHQLKVWALDKRKPWFHLFLETTREFLPRILVGLPKYQRPAPWLNTHFVKQHRSALAGYEPRLNVFGSLPSLQMNLDTLNGLRGQLGSCCASASLYEKRYPYLDRDLLEFLYAIPREQLVRPGQRRSLMRRALKGIVPDVILQRRRKAFVSRAPLAALKQDWGDVVQMSHNMLSEKIGIVDSAKFLKGIQDASAGREIPLTGLLRTLVLESWLRGLTGLEPSPFAAYAGEDFWTSDALSPDHTRVQLAE
jgi:asparagine synthase (glutamine-hydrolysing)